MFPTEGLTYVAVSGMVDVQEAVDQIDRSVVVTERAGPRIRPPLVSVLYGAIALLSAQPITWAAGLLTTMFVPRYLDAQALGQYTVAITITSLVGTVLGLGLTTSLTRRVAANPTRAVDDATAALVLVLGLSIPVAVGLAIVGPWVGVPIDPTTVLPIALAGMVVATAQTVLSSVLIGQQRHARFAWLNGLGVAVTAVAGIAVLMAGGGLAAYLAVGVGVTALVIVIGWRTAHLGFNLKGVSRTRLLDLAREGLPFLGWNVATRLRGDIEIGLLAALMTQQVVGWWGAATRIIGVPIFIPSLITTPLLPALSQHTDDIRIFDQTLRRSLILVIVLTLPASAMILALAPEIPSLFGWRAEFQNSVPLIMVLSMQVPLVSVGMVLGAGLIAIGDERRWLVVNGFATLMTAVGAWLAITASDSWFHNGAIGAAVVRVLGEVIMIVGALFLLPRGTLDWQTTSLTVRTVIASTAVVLVASSLGEVSIVLAGAAGGATYAIALLVLRVVRLTEVLTTVSLARRTMASRRARARA